MSAIQQAPDDAAVERAATQLVTKDLVELAAKILTLTAALLPALGFITRYLALRLDPNVAGVLALTTAVPLVDAAMVGLFTLLTPAALLIFPVLVLAPVLKVREELALLQIAEARHREQTNAAVVGVVDGRGEIIRASFQDRLPVRPP